MFFWKDMLARKKRDDKFDNRNKTKHDKSIVFGSESQPKLSRVREKRQQADEWPINYIKDDQKLSYKKQKRTKYLKRIKRIIAENEIEENRSINSTTLQDKDYERIYMRKKLKRKRAVKEKRSVKKELPSEEFPSFLSVNEHREVIQEQELKRSKRGDTASELD